MHDKQCSIQSIDTALIIYDDFFRISKRNYNNALPASIRNSGMLEIPYVVKSESGYKILTCHNRIKILKETGASVLKCFVLNHPDAEVFINYAAVKTYRNELGPFGKLKTLSLLKNFFRFDENLIKDLCTKILKIPGEILENENYLNVVLDFPEELVFYIDEKDIGFKIIKDISLMPENWIALIDSWVSRIQVRVNIFRMLADHVYDIYRRGDDILQLESLDLGDDKSLYDSVFRIRYPEFTKMKNVSESLMGELTGSGISIDFPEYFDRGYLTVKLDITKKHDCTEQLKKISKLDVKKIEKLLSLL